MQSNVMTAAAGFLLACRWHIDFWLLFGTLAGTALVIACGCVFNNYIDRPLDAKMARTKRRATVTGQVSGQSAILYGTMLGVLGFGLLALLVNWLVVGLGAVALFFYVAVYGIAKRRSVHGTLIGTIPGAIPPVAGYSAVTGHIDMAAMLLFAVLVCWQMPHFYSIAMYRFKDYKAAGLPVMPVKHGFGATKVQVIIYIFGLMLVLALMTTAGYTGYLFLTVMLPMCILWLRKGLSGYRKTPNEAWGKQMFLFSLIVLLSFSVMLSINPFMP